jgi:Fe2+ transport system protein B
MVVLDATKLELGLYLLLENLERFRRVMVILNKMDAAAEQDIVIYHDRLETELQVPVLPESATGYLNTKEMFDTIFEVAHKELQGRTHAVRYGAKIENALATVREQFEDIPGGNGRWQAIKSVEAADETLQTEIISSRYNVASDIAARVEKIRPAGETPSDRIDRWMLHRAWGSASCFILLLR